MDERQYMGSGSLEAEQPDTQQDLQPGEETVNKEMNGHEGTQQASPVLPETGGNIQPEDAGTGTPVTPGSQGEGAPEAAPPQEQGILTDDVSRAEPGGDRIQEGIDGFNYDVQRDGYSQGSHDGRSYAGRQGASGIQGNHNQQEYAGQKEIAGWQGGGSRQGNTGWQGGGSRQGNTGWQDGNNRQGYAGPQGYYYNGQGYMGQQGQAGNNQQGNTGPQGCYNAQGYGGPHINNQQYYAGQEAYSQKQPLKEKNSNNKIIIIAVFSILAILVLLFIILLGSLTHKIATGAPKPAKDIEEEYQEDDFWEKSEKEETETETEEYGYDEDAVYGTTPDADYYSGLTDSINTTTDYSIEWENYTYTDEDIYAYIQVDYAQIKGGDIPNLENINDNLEAYAKDVVDFYEQIYTENAVEGDFLEAYSTGYITYNDETKISVVISENLYMQDASYGYLLALNVDLINGKLMWNTEILDLDDEFVDEFRRQIKIQNGRELELSDNEIYQALSDEDSLILFYTPVGLEVGINYYDEYDQLTWITATFKDYYKFTKSA